MEGRVAAGAAEWEAAEVRVAKEGRKGVAGVVPVMVEEGRAGVVPVCITIILILALGQSAASGSSQHTAKFVVVGNQPVLLLL